MQTESGVDQERLKQLKHELKKYETAFKAKHGRAAERDEIRNDPATWTKYGEYKALQKRLSKPTHAPTEHQKQTQPAESTVLKERSANAMSVTPSKRKRGQEKVEVSHEIEQTPACVRQALGPTPQRDGAVLGIFDVIQDGTPSKDEGRQEESAPMIGGTPSKSKPSSSNENGLSRTPQSSGKRFFLGAFARTPMKRKSDEDIYTPSTAKHQFATPAFLRRSNTLPTLFEETHDDVTSAPPFKKRGLVRSLSTIIQGLKKQEEQRMDDDWDIMNEMEADERGEDARPAPPKVLVEDSQAVEMPLGPDQGVGSDEDEGEGDPGALDANGKPRKVWKKKGLKRQTRRTNMKPVLHKPKKAVEFDGPGSETDDDDAVEGTQVVATKRSKKSGDEGEEEQRYDSLQGQTIKAKPSSAKITKEATQKRKKKIGPQDHANFRRLNIKNKNSKAKGRGRFGRR